MKPGRKRREKRLLRVKKNYGHRVFENCVELGPNDGEAFVHCGHPHKQPITFVKMPYAQAATDPAGSNVIVRFASGCTACIDAAKGDFNRILMHGVAYWNRRKDFQSN